MTFAELSKIITENNIPETVTLMSDSGWECDPTDMNGIYYDRKENILIFTQDANYDYDVDSDFEFIYGNKERHIQHIEAEARHCERKKMLQASFNIAINEALRNMLSSKETSFVNNVQVSQCVKKDQPIAGLNVSDKYIDITFKDISTGNELHNYSKLEDIIK